MSGTGGAVPSNIRAGTASPVDALRIEEAKRTRDVLRLGWVVAVAVSAGVLVVPGSPALRAALLGALAVGVVVSEWVRTRLADPHTYVPARMNVLALVALVAGLLGVLYVGVFSAVPIMIGLGLYFFCRTESLSSAIATYVLAASSHGIAALLVVSGAAAEPGFYRIGASLSLEAQLTGQFLIQFAYALCFWLSRTSRAASLRALEQLQAATRLATQRDVQLAELRRDLDHALGAGGPGRFSTIVVGSWELGFILGRGAMGEVYAATHTRTGEQAAVKLLRSELLTESRHLERFLREVRIASAIDSPHVVRVLDASSPGDSIPYLAMEQLAGETLSSLLRNGKSLDSTSLRSLVTQISAVLDAARAAGIVHRDIKPQNLMLTRDGVWKLLDFGVALLADTSGTLTRGAAIGTPSYMPPEQARGDTVDHRADIYALGAVVYRCVTGRVPFARSDTPSLLYAVVHDMPVRPSALAAISPALEDVLHVALAKDPDARFQSARELADAFTSALADEPSASIAPRARALPPWREPAPS